MKTIKGVTIGDKFTKNTETHIFQVVDFYELVSCSTGKNLGYKCIAKCINSEFAINEFEVPFATVLRTRI